MHYLLPMVIFLALSCAGEDSRREDPDLPLATIVVNPENDALSVLDISPVTRSATALSAIDNRPVGIAFKILSHRERYYILDWKTKQIYIFDVNGHFLSSLADQGRGPGELLFAIDFCIDDQRNELNVIDVRKGEVLAYTTSGRYLETKSLGTFYCNAIVSVDSNTFFATNYQFSEETKYLVETGKDFHEVISSHFVPEMDIHRSYSHPHMFTRRADLVYFSMPFADTIFKLSRGHVEPAYRIDFGASGLTAAQRSLDRYQLEAAIQRENKAANATNFHAFDNYIYFAFRSGRDVIHYFHDLSQGTGMAAKQLELGGVPVELYGYSQDGEKLIGSIAIEGGDEQIEAIKAALGSAIPLKGNWSEQVGLILVEVADLAALFAAGVN